jgi:radical SAM protein with 4Fe4S-binding SPASM domain
MEKDDYPKQVLDLEFAKKGLSDFYEMTKSNYLGFFASGEPTLEIKIMDEILEYARDLIGDIKVELQTNGCFNRKTLEWLHDNIDILWISGDGPIEINDMNRTTKNGRGSGRLIEKNIKQLMELKEQSKKDMVIGIRSTIGNFNVKKQKELIDYYYDLGVRAIYVDQICAQVSKDENKYLTGEVDSIIFAQEFLKAYKYAKSLGVFYGTIATMNFDEEVDIACRSLLPAPHLTPSGIVSSCEMCYEEGSPLDIFIYGKWNEEKKIIEYDYNKIEKLKSRRVENLIECKGCEYIYNCAGSCAGESFNETGDLYKRNERLCKIVKYLGKELKRNEGIYPYLHP